MSILFHFPLRSFSELLVYWLAGDFEVLVCLSATGQGAPQSSYKKTITTTGSSCQLEGYTEEGPGHDQGMHTPMCLPVHTNTSTSTFIRAGYLSIRVHPLMLTNQPQTTFMPTPSVLSPPSFICRDGALHHQTTQNLSTHQGTWSPVPEFWHGIGKGKWTHTLLAKDQPQQTSVPVCLPCQCNSQTVIHQPCSMSVGSMLKSL